MARMIDVLVGLAIATPLSRLGPEGVRGPWLGAFGFVFYLLVADGFGGRSLGKRMLGLTVVHLRSQRPISILGSFMRNGSLLCFSLLDLLLLFSARGRRLGDLMIGAKVVEHSRWRREHRPGPRGRRIALNSLYLGLMVGFFVVLVAPFWMLRDQQFRHSDVLVINALPVSVRVDFGRKRIDLDENEHRWIKDVRVGTYELLATTSDRSVLEEFDLVVPLRHEVLAYNVRGAAPLIVQEFSYLSSGEIEMEQEFERAGERVVLLEVCDFFGQESLDTPSGWINDRLFDWEATSLQVRPGGWHSSLVVLANEGRTQLAEELVSALRQVSPNDEALMFDVIDALGWIPDSESLVDFRMDLLTEFPTNLALQRAHQAKQLEYGELELLEQTYRELAAAHPDSASLAYLMARVADPEDFDAITRELVERFPSDHSIAAQRGLALHRLGEFLEAQTHFEGAWSAASTWEFELMESAVLNLLALGRQREGIDLLEQLEAPSGTSDYEFLWLAARVHQAAGSAEFDRVMEPYALPIENRIDEGIREWTRMHGGKAPQPKERDEAIEDREFRETLRLARLLESKPQSGLKWLEKKGFEGIDMLDAQRTLLLAWQAHRAGDEERMTELLHHIVLPTPWLVAAIEGGSEDSAAMRLSWDLRAVLKFCEALELPADSEERRQAMKHAAEQDFCLGFVSRVAGSQ